MSIVKAWSTTLMHALESLELASSGGTSGEWFRDMLFAQFQSITDPSALEAALVATEDVWRTGRELLSTWSSEEQELSLFGLLTLIKDIEELIDATATLDVHLDPELPGQLLNTILTNTLVSHHPLVGFVFALLGLIELNTYDKPALISSERDGRLFPLGPGASFRFDHLANLIQNPKSYFISVSNRAHRRVEVLYTMERLLAPVLGESFSQMGWTIETVPSIVAPSGPTFESLDTGKWAYELIRLDVLQDSVFTINVGLCRQFASYGVLLQIQSGLIINYEGEDFQIGFESNGTPATLALGQFGVLFEAGVSTFDASLSVSPGSLPTTPVSFGIDNVFQLTFKDPTLHVGIDGPDVDALHAEINSRVALTLGSGESDSFVSSILSSFSDAPVEAQVAIAWNRKQGVHLKGSGDFSLSLPIKLPESSPVQVTNASIGLSLPDEDSLFAIHVAASVSAKLGPISLIVERLGLSLGFDTSQEGTIGARLDADILPPLGVGMSIDTPAVSGGGYLFFDWEKGEYGGAVALDMGALSLRALGIITTRLPGGEQGFSMIVVITADFEPIQIGLGFTLNGVGGLFGVNRTIEIEVLRQGLKEGVLDAVLLSDGGTPEEFIARAPELLSILGDVFPISKGQYLFGPIVTLGWGTPTLISARLGVIVELPRPLRMVLVGTVIVQLPIPEAPIVDLRMDVLGVFEPTEKRASLDATLFDSRIGPYSVSGDMAFRMSWGDRPSFLLSIGGFHPAFEAPPALSTMKRLTISLGKGSNPRIALEAYIALTSNTVQMGARLDLYASELGFAISGSLGFDALLYLEPFSLQVDLFAKVALIRMKSGSKIMSVDVSASLTGPSPWRVSGLAEFKFLGIPSEVPFSKTFGPPVESEPPTVEVWPLLSNAISEPRSWSSQLPSDVVDSSGVTLEARDVDDSSVLVHPSSALEMSQQVIPLGMSLERFGVAKLDANEQFFGIKEVKLGGQNTPFEDTNSHFAPGEYLELTEQEKLSRPSFEELSAGLTLRGTQGFTLGSSRSLTVGYEQRVMDHGYSSPASDQNQTLSWDTSLALASLSSSRPRTYQEPSLGVTWQGSLYVIVNTHTLNVPPDFAGIEDTYINHVQRLNGLPSTQSQHLSIVASHEIQAA